MEEIYQTSLIIPVDKPIDTNILSSKSTDKHYVVPMNCYFDDQYIQNWLNNKNHIVNIYLSNPKNKYFLSLSGCRPVEIIKGIDKFVLISYYSWHISLRT